VAQRGVTLPGPDGVTLQAELYLPDGPVRGPAVLGLHGCAGFRNRAGEVTGLYRDWARLFNARGQAVLLPTTAADRFQLSAAMVEAAWSAKTRGVLLASPSNPTGTSIHPDELRRIHIFDRQLAPGHGRQANEGSHLYHISQ